ncbi:LysM peptidoglycan-binding domain-containing protein [Roseobacter sp. HKCC-CH-9208]|uniref:LysM peptidoglycan-binding domain-containing protein n=1 Tax=Roseobacter sp. HKCC-CH-9208 TaxID=3120339 RepID=UPI0030ED0B79
MKVENMANGSKVAGGLSGLGMGIIALAIAALGYLGWQVVNEDRAGEEAVAEAPAVADDATNGTAAPEPAEEVAAEEVSTEVTEETAASETAVEVASEEISTEVVEETAASETAVEAAAEEVSSEVTEETTAAETASDETTAPETPSTAQEAADVAEAVVTTAPVLDVIRVSPDGMTVIAGSAMPNAEIYLLLDGVDSADATADRAGNFVLLSKLAPSDSPRLLSVEATDETGARVAAAQTLVVAPIAAPVTVAEATDEAETVTQSTTTPIVLQSDGQEVSLVQGGSTDGAALSIDTVSYSSAGDVQIAGRADSGAALRVYLNNALVAEVTGAEDGTWRADVANVAAGAYDLRIDQLAADGTVIARSETSFIREAAAEIADAAGGAQNAIRVVTVERGFTLWGIAENMLGSGFDYVQIFNANRDQIRDPDLIYPGQVFTIPAQ